MHTRSWLLHAMALPAVLRALPGGLLELLALQAWRLRERLDHRR